MRFCPKCGKKGIKGVFCRECTEQELDISFKDIVIKSCVSCDAFMIRHSWKSFSSSEEAIITAVSGKIKNPSRNDLKIIPAYEKQNNKPGLRQQMEVRIIAAGQEFLIPGFVEYTYCPKCTKEGSQYYEGDLQVRNANEEVLKFIYADISAHKKDGVHITKEMVKGRDLDLNLTSAKYLRALGKRLKQRFNGELTETSKLFSYNKQTSKDIHRISVLFKLREYKVGQIIEIRGRKIKITKIGKRVSGIDIENGKNFFVNQKL